MEMTVFDVSGNPAGQVDVSDFVFGIEPNVPVMHQALVRQLANARKGTADTLTRVEVSRDANKIQIKEAVEQAFGVTVMAVNTMNVRGKERRRSRQGQRRPTVG